MSTVGVEYLHLDFANIVLLEVCAYSTLGEPPQNDDERVATYSATIGCGVEEKEGQSPLYPLWVSTRTG